LSLLAAVPVSRLSEHRELVVYDDLLQVGPSIASFAQLDPSVMFPRVRFERHMSSLDNGAMSPRLMPRHCENVVALGSCFVRFVGHTEQAATLRLLCKSLYSNGRLAARYCQLRYCQLILLQP
jgi:hypothetical protein